MKIKLSAPSAHHGRLDLSYELVELKNYRKQRVINIMRNIESSFRYFAKHISDPHLVAIALAHTYGEHSVYALLYNAQVVASPFKHERLFAIRYRHHYVFVKMEMEGVVFLDDCTKEAIFQEAERLTGLLAKPSQQRNLSQSQRQKLQNQLSEHFGPEGSGAIQTLKITTWAKKRS